jgi:S1-C subfamily serine protease/antitoxin component YwqK of YwqJK toxin-antitoxin module
MSRLIAVAGGIGWHWRLLAVLVILAFADNGYARTWMDATGKHTVDADLVAADDSNVVLKKADGRLITMPVEKLSHADREFLKRKASATHDGSSDSHKSGSVKKNEKAVPEQPAGPLADLAERVQKSIVLIAADGGVFGSGFVIDADGIIVTNYHVIEGTSRASATFRDGVKLEAAGYVAYSRGKDLALLRVYPKAELQALPLASAPPQLLDSVIAFGCPKGFAFTITRGDVSAVRTGREIRQTLLAMEGDDIYRQVLGYDDDAVWVQTTAPISSGNSGGPLVNMQGQVVGVNTWGHLKAQNLNFAISAIEVINLMKKNPAKEPKLFASLPRTIHNRPVGYPRVPNPGRPSTEREIHIVFPSGKALGSEVFAVSYSDTVGLIEGAYGIRHGSTPRLCLHRPNGSLLAVVNHVNGILNGAAIGFFENKELMVYATYQNGCRHGIIRTWDVNGNDACWAQYSKGKRDGFCCLLKDGRLRMVLECSVGKTTAVHLISDDQVERSFSTTVLAEQDEVARAALKDLDKLETDILAKEREFKKLTKKEDAKQRQGRVSQVNPGKREAASSRISQHAKERNDAIHAIRRATAPIPH